MQKNLLTTLFGYTHFCISCHYRGGCLGNLEGVYLLVHIFFFLVSCAHYAILLFLFENTRTCNVCHKGPALSNTSLLKLRNISMLWKLAVWISTAVHERTHVVSCMCNLVSCFTILFLGFNLYYFWDLIFTWLWVSSQWTWCLYV